MPKSRPAPHVFTYQLKITLCDSKPTIWRRIQVPGNIILLRLHDVLQAVMGWTNSHMHQFQSEQGTFCIPDPDSDPNDYDERKHTLADLLLMGAEYFIYEYDLGDSWEHEIKWNHTCRRRRNGARYASPGRMLVHRKIVEAFLAITSCLKQSLTPSTTATEN